MTMDHVRAIGTLVQPSLEMASGEPVMKRPQAQIGITQQGYAAMFAALKTIPWTSRGDDQRFVAAPGEPPCDFVNVPGDAFTRREPIVGEKCDAHVQAVSRGARGPSSPRRQKKS